MPNRIIKESICYSESIDALTWFEECFFYRLIVNADDFGRMDGRPKILKAKLFPLKDGITEKQIREALNKLSTAGMVQVYMHDQKLFLQLAAWNSHQQIRATKSKYPAPENICNQLISFDINCPRNPIQSESKSESESILPGTKIIPDRNDLPVIELTLNDNSVYPVFKDQVKEWADLYPAADVMQQLRNMKGWLDANPKKRKTKSGIKRFINGWLAKEQDRGNSLGSETGIQSVDKKNYTEGWGDG